MHYRLEFAGGADAMSFSDGSDFGLRQDWSLAKRGTLVDRDLSLLAIERKSAAG